MRFTTLLYTLFGLVAMSIAVPSGVEPGVELLPKLRPKTERRQVSVIEGLQPREIGGGFVAVLPDDNAIPADSDGGSNSRRRFLRKDEVVVPESLQEPSSKRAVYYCRNSGYGICSGTNYCCPLGGDCCLNRKTCCRKGEHCCRTKGCCRDSENCVIVNGKEGCCPLGKTCVTTGNGCVTAGYVPCSNDNFCCKPGYTCYRDSLGTRLCRAPGSNNDHTTTTKRTTTTTTTTTPDVAKPTTVKLPKDTTTTDVQDTSTTDAQDTTATDAQVQATDTTSFTFPTTTPTPAPASNTTSSASRTSSTPDVPIVAANGATAVSFREGHLFFVAPVLLALGHALIIA